MIHEPVVLGPEKRFKNSLLIHSERDKRVGTGFDDPEFKTDLTDIIDKEDNECLFAFYNIFIACYTFLMHFLWYDMIYT